MSAGIPPFSHPFPLNQYVLKGLLFGECLQAFLYVQTLSPLIECVLNGSVFVEILQPFLHFHIRSLSISTSMSASIPSFSNLFPLNRYVIQHVHCPGVLIVEALRNSSLRPGFKSSDFLHQLLMSSASFLAPKGSHGF